MNTAEFIRLVSRMRDAQKEYFKTRDKRILQRSIMLEGLVDTAIKEYQQPNQTTATQQSLFPEE